MYPDDSQDQYRLDDECQPNTPRTTNARLQAEAASPDFRSLVESRIKQLWVEQRHLQTLLDGLPSRISPDMNQALCELYFRARQ